VGPSADLLFTEEHDMATSRIVNLAAAAAMTGLIGGAALSTVGCQKDAQPGTSMGAAATAAHDCKGQNACKGQGGCKTADHGCKGQNACKGQGGCKAM
jgi:hypothetical protein